ncbi:MAG TPA: dolichyl-phosphate beta-glucosyltransferase [Candidatus Nanoarchaeia archaeon]|nr:dolichyl-phosphate beta-glucosyltransferase [Candidatus Nanoarchaeia archaeon]
MVKLSIIIPAYNEEKRIEKTLVEYCDFFKGKIDFEIHVVINGCVDNTLGVLKKIAKKYKQINFVDIGKVGSKGAAVNYGFKIAEGELIGFVDADLATKPDSFYDLVQNIEGYDGVIASRWIEGAKIDKKQPFTRIFAGRSFNFLVNLFFNLRIKDTQCGAKLFRKKAIKIVCNELGITRWAFDVDLLYQMKKHGFKIKEIPTTWTEPGGGHLKSSTIIDMFLAILRLRLIYSPFKFIVKLYDMLPRRLHIGEIIGR